MRKRLLAFGCALLLPVGCSTAVAQEPDMQQITSQTIELMQQLTNAMSNNGETSQEQLAVMQNQAQALLEQLNTPPEQPAPESQFTEQEPSQEEPRLAEQEASQESMSEPQMVEPADEAVVTQTEEAQQLAQAQPESQQAAKPAAAKAKTAKAKAKKPKAKKKTPARSNRVNQQTAQLMRQQQLLQTLQLQQQVYNMTFNSLNRHSNMINNQIDYMSKSQACMIAGNCYVRRVPAIR